MKKILGLVLALAMLLSMTAALAEESLEASYEEMLEDYGFVPYTVQVPESKVFESVWITEDSDWRVEAFAEDGGFKLMVVHRLEGKEDVWEYAAGFNGEDKTLVADPVGLYYTQNTDDENAEWDTHYEDGEAVFAINEDGKLTWKDAKEDAGSGLEFIRIGTFYKTNWKKDNCSVEFYDWYEGEYDIRVFKYGTDGEIADDAILKGTYDAETNTVAASGCFNDGETFDVTFSYNEDFSLVWSQDGVDTVFNANFDS